jgi:polar amino acid transport system substrate-binding protein
MSRPGWSRRDLLRRGALIGATALGGPTLLSAACTSPPSGVPGTAAAAGTVERLRQVGTIRVGLADGAPYGFTDDRGEVTGQSVEVARAVLARIGIGRVETVTVAFGDLISGLTLSRRFDMIAAGMFITPERCRAAAFSDPDYTAGTALLVARGNPAAVATLDDVRDKDLRIAVVDGSVEQGYASSSGIPGNRVEVVGDRDALLQAVTSGRSDCAALTTVSLADLVSKNSGAPVEATAGFFPTVDGKQVVSAGAFVFRKGEDDILDAFNTELAALHRSGEWLRIVTPFGFTQDNLPGPELTTARLCAG